ncbi:hypothetical protein B0H14DRAFT_3618735 [Mycena olivaceomarginata]|nr:hypothetical protein B0H14DRAFT_3618735 [Mycena olivaceomarginata]
MEAARTRFDRRRADRRQRDQNLVMMQDQNRGDVGPPRATRDGLTSHHCPPLHAHLTHLSAVSGAPPPLSCARSDHSATSRHITRPPHTFPPAAPFHRPHPRRHFHLQPAPQPPTAGNRAAHISPRPGTSGDVRHPTNLPPHSTCYIPPHPFHAPPPGPETPERIGTVPSNITHVSAAIPVSTTSPAIVVTAFPPTSTGNPAVPRVIANRS